MVKGVECLNVCKRAFKVLDMGYTVGEAGRQCMVLGARVGDGSWKNGHVSKLGVPTQCFWSGTWGQ